MSKARHMMTPPAIWPTYALHSIRRLADGPAADAMRCVKLFGLGALDTVTSEALRSL